MVAKPLLPWVPEVFSRVLPDASVSAAAHLRPKAEVTSGLLERLRFTFTPNRKREFVPRDKVWPKPETAHEKSLAPRVSHFFVG